ncbi:subunit 17 of mediator complex-domain-containing protein [Polychytrium aggregatum]|uniref:subunit 17 of mediator complex-domain-containing protein n=1 Tax=Polychytrium aggregatum TaxID=110093 RepID=UPI0022FEBEB1|nr:subunit 17 of mediator complex-domain-containing protein [Polychytrium aggregatum]KAI9197518.1 subunit 17 of mediator complex-domain-containing protein [Polychytrium aggregatum]
MNTRIGLEGTQSLPFDFSVAGELIFQPSPSPSELFARNVAKLKSSEAAATTADKKDQPDQPPVPVHPLEPMKHRIFLAKEETKLMHDIVSRLLINTPAASKYSDLPPPAQAHLKLGLVPRKLETPIYKQIDDLQYALAAKKEHLHDTAKRLSDSSVRILKALTRENQFYGETALRLRQNSWILQARGEYGGRLLFIDYGFSNAGSTYYEIGEADILRDIRTSHGESQDTSVQDVTVVMPHTIDKRLTIHWQHSLRKEASTAPPFVSRDMSSMDDDDIGDEAGSPCTTCPDEWIHQKLLTGRNSIFEAELFHLLSRDAAGGLGLARNSVVATNSISIAIDGASTVEIKLTNQRDTQDNVNDRSRLLEIHARQALRKLHRTQRAVSQQHIIPGLSGAKRQVRSH